MHSNRRPWIAIWLCALLLLGVAAPAGAQTPAVSPGPTGATTAYRMTLDFDPAARTLGGSEEIDWVNTTGAAQAEVYLRLYPKAGYYRPGDMTLGNTTVNGQPATLSSGKDATAARVTLPESVPPSGRATIALTFTTTIPIDASANFGALRFDSTTGIWALADWYPVVAGYEPGKGWYLAPPSWTYGDPTFSAVADYDVRLTLPADLAVAGSGSETGAPVTAGSGRVTRHFTTAAPARELAFAIGAPGPVMTRTVDGVNVRIVTLGQPFTQVSRPDAITEIDAFSLDVAAAAFATYSRWLGPYGERELDVVYLSVNQALGVSWSGMTWISRPHILDDGQVSDDERTQLAFTIAHEVGHQWLGSIVGSNNNESGFISESLDNALTPAALAGAPLTATTGEIWRTVIGTAYLPALRSDADGVVDRPLSASDAGGDRSALIYGKGPLGFAAICQRIGPDAFFAGLRAYAAHSWYGISTPADLRGALEMAAAENGRSPTDVDALWEHWFERTDTTTVEVEHVLAGAGRCVPSS